MCYFSNSSYYRSNLNNLEHSHGRKYLVCCLPTYYNLTFTTTLNLVSYELKGTIPSSFLNFTNLMYMSTKNIVPITTMSKTNQIVLSIDLMEMELNLVPLIVSACYPQSTIKGRTRSSFRVLCTKHSMPFQVHSLF